MQSSATRTPEQSTAMQRPWLQLLIAAAVVAVLGCLALEVRSGYAAHKAWLPAGAAVAFVALWGARMLVAAAVGTLVSALWWTGAVEGAAMFAIEQAAVAGVGGLLGLWPRNLDLRFHKLGDMGRFIVVCAAGYALAGAIALSAVPQSVIHVRADLAGATRHSNHEVTHGAAMAQTVPPAPRLLQHTSHAASAVAQAGAASAAHPNPRHPPEPAGATQHGASAPAAHSASSATAAPAHSPGHPSSPRFEWAVADMLGVLLIAPALFLLLHNAPHGGNEAQSQDARTALTALLLLIGTTWAIYSGWLEGSFGLRHTTLFVLPPAAWLALRHPAPYTLFGNLAVVFIADVGTSLGHGPFSDHTSGLPLLHLVFVSTTLLMAASQRERALAIAQVQRLATRDPLTDLPNRNLLALRLDCALATARRYAQRVGVLFIDLDHFKRINDSLGHAVGDQLLIAATGRIASVLRTDSLLARVGGDEFVVVTERLQDPEDISRTAARTISALEQPFEIGPHVLTISCSVGVATFPDDGATSSDLIKHADIAMYQAKTSGRNQFRFFSPAMNEQVRQRLEIENGLRAAVQNQSLVLHYQPLVDARSGKLQSVEALIRWQRADGTLVLPGEFIRVAEESGLIESMGAWAVHEAARQVRQWRTAGLVTVPVSVNLSARQLRNAQALSDLVCGALQQHQLDGADLVLEITETMLLHLGGDVEDALRQLSRHGVRLALDDFGTGYSSLGYLARLPIDSLKIDRSFVREMLERTESRRLVKAIIELAHLLGMSAVAEGVETQDQRCALLEMGVDALQGHLFAPALPAQEFAASHLAATRLAETL